MKTPLSYPTFLATGFENTTETTSTLSPNAQPNPTSLNLPNHILPSPPPGPPLWLPYLLTLALLTILSPIAPIAPRLHFLPPPLELPLSTVPAPSEYRLTDPGVSALWAGCCVFSDTGGALSVDELAEVRVASVAKT